MESARLISHPTLRGPREVGWVRSPPLARMTWNGAPEHRVTRGVPVAVCQQGHATPAVDLLPGRGWRLTSTDAARRCHFCRPRACTPGPLRGRGRHHAPGATEVSNQPRAAPGDAGQLPHL